MTTRSWRASASPAPCNYVCYYLLVGLRAARHLWRRRRRIRLLW